MSLFDILGFDRNADGIKALGEWLKVNYIDNPIETARIAHARLLDEFYEGGGDDEMKRVIDIMYKSKENQDRRKAVIDAELDKYDNILARIVNEKAVVYAEPARRTIKNNNEAYQVFNERVAMDAVMMRLDQMLALHGEALLWYRVRLNPLGEREALLEVVSPAAFWAVHHPKDRTLLVAIIFDQRMPLARPEQESFRVWTHDETFVMNAKCEIFADTIEAWSLGVMPGVLASMSKPGSKPTLLTHKPNQDLLSAQKNIRLQATNLTKESVSATKQTYLSGDMSTAAMGQTSDSEGEVLLPEGSTVQAIDRGMDLEQFRESGGYVGDAVASNHGLAPSVLRNRDASSGAEIELRRLPIREQRKKRIPVMRAVERDIFRVIAMVNGGQLTTDEDGEPKLTGDMPEFAFSPEGWSIDFGEVQQPMSAMEALAVFEKERELGGIDNYEWEMKRNPDIKTLEEAKQIVDERNKRRADYMRSLKDYQAQSGALGAMQPRTPFEVNRGEPQDSTEQEDTSASGMQ